MKSEIRRATRAAATVSIALFLFIPAFAGFATGAAARPIARAASTAVEDSETHISAKDLKARLDKGDKVIIIDSRAEVSGPMIKGAVHVPTDRIDEWAKTADKKAFIVAYCTCPHDEAADSATERLRDMGFEKAFSLSGGLNAAREAGIPLEERLQ